jgi:hypothetical protein
MSDELDSIQAAGATEVVLHVNAVDPDSGGSGDGHLDPGSPGEDGKKRRAGHPRAAAGPGSGEAAQAPSLNPSTLLSDEASLTHSARAIQERRPVGTVVAAGPAVEQYAAESATAPEEERVHIQVFA